MLLAVMEEAALPSASSFCRNGATVIAGAKRVRNYAASDASALLQVTRRMIYLERWRRSPNCPPRRLPHRQIVTNGARTNVARTVAESELTISCGDGPLCSFHAEGIFEQPGVVANTLEMVQTKTQFSIHFPRLFWQRSRKYFHQTENILILACGTSYPCRPCRPLLARNGGGTTM